MKSDADDLSRVLTLQVKFGCQRWINHRDLGACVHEKVLRAGVVDHDRQNDLGALDEPKT